MVIKTVEEIIVSVLSNLIRRLESEMEWTSLLSSQRLRHHPTSDSSPGRNAFQQDLDRIVFSNAFRRLANKTQVHPLAPNDHIHTRLTHSIEVASVGRSLGTQVGEMIGLHLKDKAITADHIGSIVQAACLAHDIGTPPFGHAGEEAIREWFISSSESVKKDFSSAQCADFQNFEGNAQGFRLLTQLENNKLNGGLQLTYAVLGTYAKYPRSSVEFEGHGSYSGAQKVGFFDSEQEYFSEIADALGLMRRRPGDNVWCRHPLAFLVEAADDICYAVVDIEDGFQLGYLSYDEAADVLRPIADPSLDAAMDPTDKIAKLRATTIGELVTAVSKAFVDNQAALLDGTQADELLQLTKFGPQISCAKEVAKRKIYQSDRKTRLEIAGTEIIGGLLDIFSNVVVDLEKVGFDHKQLKGDTQRLARLMGTSLHMVNNNYATLLCVTDCVSGMTDRYAVDVYRTLKGITI